MASLKNPGAILLLSCYELGRQPLSLASSAAVLRRAGYRPALLDLSQAGLDEDAVRRATLVAIAVPMHTALRLGVRVAERVRAVKPDVRLCFFGLYAALNAETLLALGADAVIGGEFEAPLLSLAESIETGGGAGRGVRTLAHPAGPWLEKTDFALPYRDALPPLERYVRLEVDTGTRLAGHVEASRGCLHLCRHCPIPPVYGGRFFVVPRELVLADIGHQVEMGATHITFGDADFLNGPGHTLAILRDAHAAFPSLTFDLTAKIEHLLRHRDRLPEMRRLGCLFIVSAVESLSDQVLAILDKGHTRADVETALDLAGDAGIALRPTFVPFTPWSTLDDYRELLDFIEDRDLIDQIDPVQLSIRLLVPPGSLLAGRPEFLPVRGRLEAERFTWSWTHPDARMDRLQQDITRIVAGAMLEESAADPGRIFGRIIAAANGTAAAPPRRPIARRDKGRPPRLTEPWFC